MRASATSALAVLALALALSGCATQDQHSQTAKGATAGTAPGSGGPIGQYQDEQAAQMQAVLDEQDRLRRERESIYISLASDVLFDAGSARLQAGGGDKLRALAAIMARYPRTSVSIVGHTDGRGSEQSNIELSRRRAAAVADELIRQGVSSARIRSRGDGASKPIASNETPEGRQINRRVDVTISPDHPAPAPGEGSGM